MLLLGGEVEELLREEVGDLKVEEDLRVLGKDDEVLDTCLLDVVEDGGLLDFFALVSMVELLGLMLEANSFEVEDVGLTVEVVPSFKLDTVARRLDVAAAFWLVELAAAVETEVYTLK